jgi:hypothetical protein
MVASKHKWKLSAKDQAGNDISDQVSNEFRGFIEATRLDQIAPERISFLFLLNLFGAFKAGTINPFQIAREVEALEKGEPTGLKPAIQNKHPPLKGALAQALHAKRHKGDGNQRSARSESVWDSLSPEEST